MPHKKTSKHKKTKRRHRGGYYGASGAVVEGGVGPAGMRWSGGQEVPTVEVGGAPIPVNLKGGRKNRKSKKKSTKRRMRGGTKFGGTFASYEGDGARGLASVSQGTHTPGAPQLGRFNNFGAEPGNLDSFKGLRPGKF
jgi:hypothetical protein